MCPTMSALRPNRSSRRDDRARDCGGVPFTWVAADTVYGVGDIEMALRRAGKGYVLGVSSRSFPLLGQATADRRHGRRHRPDAAPVRLAAPVGGRRAPKDRGCMTGPISNWPISRPRNTTTAMPGPVDARPADPPQHRRWRSRLLHHLVPGGNIDRNAGRGRRPSLGDRGQLRDREKRVRARSQREQILAWLASPRFPGDARLRHDGRDPPSRQSAAAQKNERARQNANSPPLIRWSIQEIRRIAIRLARTTHPTRTCHRMVTLAKSSPSRRSDALTSSKKATVMLGGSASTSCGARMFVFLHPGELR